MASNITITIKDIRTNAIKEGTAVKRKYKLNSESTEEDNQQTFQQIAENINKKFSPEKIKTLAKRKSVSLKNEDLSKANENLAEIADKPVEKPSRKFGKVNIRSHRLEPDQSRIPSAMAGGADRAEETEMNLDTILEARRGRPRKDGSSKPEGDEEGGREHIVVQLRKAENLRGDRHTEFNNGEKHKLPLEHVKKALNMHSTMKPLDKEKFERRLGASHQSFMSAVRGEKEEAPKPKITLGSMAKKSMKEDVSASDKGPKKAETIMTASGPKVVDRSAPKKKIAVESVEFDELNEEILMAEQELLNNLYGKLSESNRVIFNQMLDEEDGYFKLLQFAVEQGI